MPNDTPHFDDTGRLIAPKYDDVYFSAEDGLAETQYVFLNGNRLGERFAAMSPGQCLAIGETGFGTGLNFLAAWQLFEQHAPSDARLEFISVEGFPLSREVLERALSPWPELASYRDRLAEQWGPIWQGTHHFRFEDGRVRLTLLVGEADEVLADCTAAVDAWFLDGFAPSRNPAMWSKVVFKHIARCSKPDATLATYTAAGFVRRGLQAVGFEVDKQPGFGTKRDMTVGAMAGGADFGRTDASLEGGGCSSQPFKECRSVVIIGGSLAGAFAARALAERGMSVTVFERQALCAAALPSLMPRVAVLQPKINHADDPGGRWLREGFASASRWLESDSALKAKAFWNPCGTFQSAHDERSQRRLERFVAQFEETGLCRWIDAEQTEPELGVALAVGGVVVDGGGTLLPAGLCKGLLDHPNIEVRDGVAVKALHRHGGHWVTKVDGNHNGAKADSIVIANGFDAQLLGQTKNLSLQPIRGQVSNFRSHREGGSLHNLKRPIFYGGYVIPQVDGQLTVGASFVPDDQDLSWRRAEHEAYCDKLAKLLPDEAARFKAIDHGNGWVGLRTATRKNRCYAEQIEDGLYVSLGHGSHGIASAARAADHLADLIMTSVEH